MVKSIIFTFVAFCFLSVSNAQAGDAAAGKIKSGACVGCHGMNGRSNNPQNPNLAGQKEQYLIKAIKDYRDGKRSDPVMGIMVKGLSDQDVANLAAFYSSVK